MNPDSITIDSLSKKFEYETQARIIDSCRDIEEIRNIAKSYVKLYIKQQEVLINLDFNNL